MERDELLQNIETFSREGRVSREDVEDAYNRGQGSGESKKRFHLKISDILYYIGGGIVVIGISIFVGQNWEELSQLTRILVTFGSGVAAYVVGVLFSRDEKTERVGTAFHLIGALAIPIGLHVIFDSAGFDTASHGIQVLVSGVLFATHLASYFVYRKNLFMLFVIAFGTWLFFALTNLLLGTRPVADQFIEYRILITGLVYMLLGHAFRTQALKQLTGVLYSFGVIGFLGAALTLGGWEPNQSLFWEIIFPGLVFGVIFLSIHVRAKSFLVFGTLFLMGYIIKITAEYFSDSLGWPVALIIAGLFLMAIGYGAVRVNQKYIRR